MSTPIIEVFTLAETDTRASWLFHCFASTPLLRVNGVVFSVLSLLQAGGNVVAPRLSD